MSTRAPATMQGSSQKMQDAWVDLTYHATESFLPFVSGTVVLLVFVGFRAPVLALPALLVIGLGVMVAWISGRDFSAKSRQMHRAAESEQKAFDGMFAVLRMKWLLGRLSEVRRQATNRHSSLYHRQALHNARWQSVLLFIGGVLQIGTIIGGPRLMAMGYPSSMAVLLVLLGHSLGERFLSITGILCTYESVLHRTASVADFMLQVAARKSLPSFSMEGSMAYEFRGASGIYESAGSKHVVRLPDLSFGPGITILTGDSGSGKSTLLGVADGTVPYQGSVRVNGHEICEWNVSARIVNGSQAFGGMELPLRHLFGPVIDAKMLDVALDCAAYPEMDLGKCLSDLSGGQRRRAVLAAVAYYALTTDSLQDGALFVDEPTNDLGPRHIKRLVAGFRRLAELRPGLTIVIPTHEGRLIKIADQLVIFYGDGRALVKRRKDGRMVNVSDSR